MSATRRRHVLANARRASYGLFAHDYSRSGSQSNPAPGLEAVLLPVCDQSVSVATADVGHQNQNKSNNIRAREPPPPIVQEDLRPFLGVPPGYVKSGSPAPPRRDVREYRQPLHIAWFERDRQFGPRHS